MFQPVWNHVFALAVLSLVYVGWAAIGKHYVGKYTYFFLDHEKNGWEYYWASVAAFVVLVELCKFLPTCDHVCNLANKFSLRLCVFSHRRS